MKLQKIEIKNYRSIEYLSIEIKELNDGSSTYGLIGINEVGKSTILKAIGLKDGLKDLAGNNLPLIEDFRDENEIEISFFYEFEGDEGINVANIINSNGETGITNNQIKTTNILYSYNISNPSEKHISIKIDNIEITDIPEELRQNVFDEILKNENKTIFWTSEDRYLISKPINLSQFSEDPNVSIPLKNCFNLAGFKNIDSIKKEISLISNSTKREKLREVLGEKTTEHIHSVWPNHKIKITFDISDGLLNFHIRDLDSNEEAKTASQRSDGFRQFISFLLTISAENKNGELKNTILLLDEPETHLHPQAQEDLLKELIIITKNKNNNITFFATHSNYMIDKDDLSRNYKVTKNPVTNIHKFDQKISSYASVTYEVFDIASNDYHNELYSKLHNKYIEEDENDLNRSLIKNFDQIFFHNIKKLPFDKPWKGNPRSSTLPTHIRNCIDHPGDSMKYTEEEIRKSIELMISYL